jgi:N-acetylmuramoyl-L-alanine amidase-like protein/zinc carboxypeptidase
MSVISTAFAVAAALAAGQLAAPPPPPQSSPSTDAAPITIGRSVDGRGIRAVRVGSARARVKLLVVGSLHGNERAGEAVVEHLSRVRPPRGTALWLIKQANPDGAAGGSRHNANGVDLNRNFPYRWRPQDGVYESGSGPASEPETQALQRFVERERPRVTLWYHQALRMVVKSTGDPVLERRYSRASGLPRRRLPAYHGTATSWQNTRFGGDSAFVVELPGGALPDAGVRRHAGAVLELARAIAPPRLIPKPIPFGEERKADMRAYARRHYGIDDHRLLNPKVIVQHYTVTDSFPPVYNTFAPNRPDPELNELPGVCAHFVIDRDGTIYQLVPLELMCRHAVGLNWTAIGIEHVGTSDAQVMDNARQRAASLRLTRALQGRYGISTRNVIGHNENRSSPFHREHVERLRTQTHADFPKAVMDRYRRLLDRLPGPASMR